MKRIKAFFLRIIFYRQLYHLGKHPVMKGELFQRIQIGYTMYYYVGNFVCLKSKNQKKEF